MSAPLQTIRVRVLGKELALRTPLAETEVRRVEQYVAERIHRFSGGAGSVDTLLVAAMALMQLAEECLALKEESRILCTGCDERLSRIVDQLDREW